MARKKRTSKIALKATTRLSGLKSIDKSLDLGGGMTNAAFEAVIGTLTGSVDKLNTTLSTADDDGNAVDANEKIVADWYERMLAGVATRYGKDSTEYEMAGGTRKSERKKSSKKKVAP